MLGHVTDDLAQPVGADDVEIRVDDDCVAGPHLLERKIEPRCMMVAGEELHQQTTMFFGVISLRAQLWIEIFECFFQAQALEDPRRRDIVGDFAVVEILRFGALHVFVTKVRLNLAAGLGELSKECLDTFVVEMDVVIVDDVPVHLGAVVQ